MALLARIRLQCSMGKRVYVSVDEFKYYRGKLGEIVRRVQAPRGAIGLSWSMSHRITGDLAIDAINQAVGREHPSDGFVFHEDQDVSVNS